MPLVEVRDVHKSFHKVEILHGVTLSVKAGEIVGLVGPSGCGKTTLVDLIVGNTVASTGSVLLDNEVAPYKTARMRLGYMPQDTALYEDIRAWDNLWFFGSLYRLPKQEVKVRAKTALELACLQDQGKKIVGNYSGGMKRRLSLAIALLCDPKILIMDEPTVGLDPVHRGRLWESFRAMADKGVAILITTHAMDEAMKCDRVAMMRDGVLIACDTPAAIIERMQSCTLEDAFIKLSEIGGDGDRSA